MTHKLILLPFLFGLSLGCSSDSDNQTTEFVLGDGYAEKPGDVFTIAATVNVTYSDGQSSELTSIELTSIDVISYSQVSVIPSKYSYSLSTNGPFLLETTKEDDVLDG